MPYKDPAKRNAVSRDYYRRVGKFSPARKSPRPRPAYMKAWREANRNKIKLTLQEWRKANPEKAREHSRKHHAKHYVPKVSGTPGTVRYEAKLAGYKSGFERTLAAFMTMRKINFKYESTKIPYTLQGEYNPDFEMVDRGFFIEAKGLLDRDSKRKMVAVKKQHPELDIRFCFMDANKKIPGSKQTHSQWADKNGFPWCDRELPEEWFK